MSPSPRNVDVKDLLDPELQPVLDGFELPPIDAEGVAAMRTTSFKSPDLSDTVLRTEHLVPGDPPVPVRVHRAKGAAGLLPAVVTIHGGGYVIGSYDMDDPLLDRWCPGLGVVGVSVEYRLASETPYPGPLEDCYAALRWTLRERGRARHRQRSASASTGSAPGVGSPPRWLCSPVTGARSHWRSSCSTAPCSTTASAPPPYGPTGSTCGDRPPTSSVGGRTSATSTGPTRCPPTRPRPGPTDLAGLPPTCVIVGSIDGFRDEDIDYAQRLNQAGVACELHVIAGLPHAYLLVPGAAAVQLAMHDTDDWLARQLARLRDA